MPRRFTGVVTLMVSRRMAIKSHRSAQSEEEREKDASVLHAMQLRKLVDVPYVQNKQKALVYVRT